MAIDATSDRPAARRFYRLADQSVANIASGLLIVALLIAFLYVGKHVFEPLALAVVLSFILAPIVKRLRRLRVGRATSVIIAVAFAMGVLGALGALMVRQIADLADDLPKYESNLRQKARLLSGSTFTSGTLERASDTLKDLRKEIDKPAQSDAPSSATPPAILSPESAAKRDPSDPIPVEVRVPAPTAIESLQNIIMPLLAPLATTALVILFVGFILLQREDLRDRFLRLAGTTDLQRSTAAMNDAAARLGRLFLTQTVVNAGVGTVIGVGLWIIGVPSPILWGVLAGLMRFVPFVGSPIAAAFPLALAAAVDPGWTTVLAVLALFLVVEPIAGNVIEPMAYGRRTGLSPVAVIIATLFWTLLWGPIGLLLATPLTVCLVVLGQHVESLRFLDVLLGDTPALEPEERFYQRVLAGDATEAAEQAEEQLKTQPLSAYYDAVPMKALSLAQNDAVLGKLERDQQLEIRDTIDEVVDNLDDYADAPVEPPVVEAPDEDSAELPAPQPAIPPIVTPEQLAPSWRVTHPVLCIASRSALDEAASMLLGHLLGKHGIPAQVQPFADVARSRRLHIEAPDARIVCLSYFGAETNPVHVRYLIRRLRRAMPQARFLAGFWLLGEDEKRANEWREAVGADFVATSLREATTICVEEALVAGERERGERNGRIDEDRMSLRVNEPAE